MAQDVRVRSAQIVGRSHLLAGRNRQDAIKTGLVDIDSKKVHYGIICDGCSEGVSSEIGAGLAVSFLSRQIEILVKSKVSLEKIPFILHKRMIGFLKDILGKISFDSQLSRVDYIKNNLLFTILGFISDDTELIIFAQGDGGIIINDVFTTRDENDTPRYIGYDLVDRKYLDPSASLPPENFDVYRIPTENLLRFAIASDALAEEPSFLNELWGHASPFGLQRRVNVWSLNDHKFQDDLSIITYEKISKEGD